MQSISFANISFDKGRLLPNMMSMGSRAIIESL